MSFAVVAKIADSIYAKSIYLKKFTKNSLKRKNERIKLIVKLKNIRSSVSEIIRIIYSDRCCSENYFDLAMYMQDVIFECCFMVLFEDKELLNIVCKKIHGFHNLPRAFLDIDNPSRISVSEAIEYF
ncbi:MAG: hypothetical protein IJS94_06190, partial [Clostridia bacterium]|nr:hypothetical protein [Clostridia bacterium]